MTKEAALRNDIQHIMSRNTTTKKCIVDVFHDRQAFVTKSPEEEIKQLEQKYEAFKEKVPELLAMGGKF